MRKQAIKKRFSIAINRNWCKACYICIQACPKKVYEKGTAASDRGYFAPVVARQQNCVGCMMCELMCPDVAIAVQASSVSR